MSTPTAPSAENDERAVCLHDEAPIVLAHDHMVEAEDFARDRAGGVTAKVVQATLDARVFAPTRAEYQQSLHSTEGFMRDAMEVYDALLAKVQANPRELLVVRSGADVRAAKASDRLGLILGCEGAKLLEGRVAALRNFHRLGVRHIEFHWAIRNQLGTAQNDDGEPGLTAFGSEVVAEMNRLGMLIDVSHSSAATIADVLRESSDPVINSHTGARVFHDTPQNLWDAQIRELADNGGVAAVHFASGVLVDGDELASIADVVRHIDHLIDVGGIDSVGLGPDFVLGHADRDARLLFNMNRTPESYTWTKDLDDSGKLRNLTRALVANGYGDEDIRKILGGNLLRVIDEAMG